MKRWLLALAVLVPIGCNKDSAPKAAANDPEFDKQWSALANSGAEPVFIEGELHGSGLMGEVRRAIDPATQGSPLAKEVPVLTDVEVAKVIRTHLPQVKGCYQVEERAGAVGSGKAILQLEIDGSGAVMNTQVVAPAFAASKVPTCISSSAKAWSFPKSTNNKQAKKFSYPFVFVGG